MEIYIGTLLVLLLFSFLELRGDFSLRQEKVIRYILFLLLVLQAGLRWETGTDWYSYFDNFNYTNEVTDVIFAIQAGVEPGYGFFVLFIKQLTQSYSVFLVIHALIYYFLIFSANKKLSPFPYISLIVFYASTLGFLGSNRQLIALAICLYALQYVLEKKAIKFFLLIGLAFLFHTTAILFCVFYFLNRNIKKNLIIVGLVLAFVIGKTNFPLMLFSYVGGLLGGVNLLKAEFYAEGAKTVLSENALNLFGLIKRILFILLFLWNYKFLSSKLKYYKLLFNGYVFGLFFYFLFSSTLLILVSRGSLYFNVMECFLLSSQFLILKKRIEKFYFLILLFTVSVFLLFQSIAIYVDLFIPYKGIFINTAFFRYMY